MKEDIKAKLMKDMGDSGVDIGPILEPADVIAEVDVDIEEIPAVDLMGKLEELKPILSAATPNEVLDFVKGVLMEMGNVEVEDIEMDEVDGSDIPELLV